MTRRQISSLRYEAANLWVGCTSSAFQMSRRNSQNQLLTKPWFPSSKYELEAWATGWAQGSLCSHPGLGTLQPKGPRYSAQQTPISHRTREHMLPSSLVLSGEPGGQPASNPCPFVPGFVNLIYSAHCIYSFFATNITVDIGKIKYFQRLTLYISPNNKSTVRPIIFPQMKILFKELLWK